MTTTAFKVDAHQAIVVGGWSNALGAALREQRPASMVVQAAAHDFAPFAGAVDSVLHLRIEGRVDDGRIDAVTGLEVFRHLRSLELLAPVKRGVPSAALPALVRCALTWQPGCEALTTQPAVRSLVLRGWRGRTLASLPVSNALASLWLDRPAAGSLDGLHAAASLAELRLTNARALASLEGLAGLPLTSLDVESAPALADLSALVRLPSLRQLRLVGLSTAVDLLPLARLVTLRRLHAGGPRMPALDWPAILALPHIEFASGGWDPAVASEARLRAGVPAGRNVIRFDPVAKRGVRPLVVELSAETERPEPERST